MPEVPELVKAVDTLPSNQRNMVREYAQRAAQTSTVQRVLISTEGQLHLAAVVDDYDEVNQIEDELGERLTSAGIVFTAVDRYWYDNGIFENVFQGATSVYQRQEP